MTTTATGNPYLDRLIKLLDLDRLDNDLFLGDPGASGGPWKRLFGGLVAAQSVVAAYKTLGEGSLHSLHAYFLRPGKHDVPIRYVVYRIRDGRTFTTRDVVAYQSGEAIFNLSCSFARPEDGISHQTPMPAVPPPGEGLPDWDETRGAEEGDGREPPPWIKNSPIEIRTILTNDDDIEAGAPHRQVWMRLKGTLPDDEIHHAALITFASDRGLLGTVRRAHGIGRRTESAASLDHAMWFHYPPRWDDWLLYTSDSPAAHAARALIFGQIYRRDGTRIASVAQEGLIRPPRG